MDGLAIMWSMVARTAAPVVSAPAILRNVSLVCFEKAGKTYI
jgi:hypothetical protein